MYCPYCGNDIPDYASVCTHCASNINLPPELPESEIKQIRRRYQERFGVKDVNINELISRELRPDILPAMYISRLFAFLLDWAIVVGVIYFIMHHYREEEIGELIFLISPLWAFLYFSLLTGLMSGRTIGKAVVGIRVVMERDTSPPNLVESISRSFAAIFSFLFLLAGFIAPLFDSKSRAWHDQFAGTLVIYKR